MVNWNFCAEDYQDNSFECLKAGDYRVRIANAEETKSKSDR